MNLPFHADYYHGQVITTAVPSWKSNRNLWKYAGVTVVGSIRRDEAGQVDLERISWK